MGFKMKINILDTTLRDGKYELKANKETQIKIAKALFDYGIKYVEIGSELHLGATSDEDFEAISQIRSNHPKNKLCLGGIIFELEKNPRIFQKSRDLGLDFLRVAVMHNNLDEGMKWVKSTLNEGDFSVFVQLLCSDMVVKQIKNGNHSAINEIIKTSIAGGAKCIYIVDSFSRMLPEDVRLLYNHIKSQGDVNIGFHAHNDSLMAFANAYEFIKLGGNFIDTTLGGIGRGRGNLSLIELINLLENSGYAEKSNIANLLNTARVVKNNCTKKEKFNDLNSFALTRYPIPKEDFIQILQAPDDKEDVYSALEAN